jgi:hypothetical protein
MNKTLLTLATLLVGLFANCSGGGESNTEDKKDTAQTNSETKTEVQADNKKPIQAYEALQVEGIKMTGKPNLTSEGKTLQLFLKDDKDEVTSITVQINFCETKYYCLEATSLADFTRSYGDKGAQVSDQSGIYDSKIREEKMGDKSVFINTCHYRKQDPKHNSYRANYMEGEKHKVEVYIVGKYGKMTDDYALENALGKKIVEALMKIKPQG